MAIVPTQLLGFADGAMSQGFSTMYDMKLLNTYNRIYREDGSSYIEDVPRAADVANDSKPEIGEFSYMLVAGRFCTTAAEYTDAMSKKKSYQFA